ncbi:MAG: hypothetical protein VXY90_04615, partial [Pseudomonadota bacterium]|nr:hypothetical protein [Pseudomonadota bacterium]
HASSAAVVAAEEAEEAEEVEEAEEAEDGMVRVAAADAAGLDGALLLCEAFEAAALETLAANERQVAALNLGALPALILDGTPLVGADAILRAADASP